MKFNCRVCNGSTSYFYHAILERPQIKVVKCKNCNLVQLSSTAHISAGYYESDEYFGENLESKLVNEKSWNLKRLELISKNLIQNEKKVALDLGCGPGGFLEVGEGLFEKLYGFDLSARMRKWNTENNRLVLDNLNNVENINVVMLFHVLEHIKKPLEFLNDIKKNFINLETIIIEVPNNNELLISKVDNKRYKNNHYSLDHLNYFNSETLNALLNMSSLKVLHETQYQRYRLGNTIGWLEYGKGGYQNYFREYNDPNFHELYESYLVSRKIADTIFIIASLKKN